MMGGLRQLIFSVRGMINISVMKGSEVQGSPFRVEFSDLIDFVPPGIFFGDFTNQMCGIVRNV